MTDHKLLVLAQTYPPVASDLGNLVGDNMMSLGLAGVTGNKENLLGIETDGWQDNARPELGLPYTG